jgi:hypothetical protein
MKVSGMLERTEAENSTMEGSRGLFPTDSYKQAERVDAIPKVSGFHEYWHTIGLDRLNRLVLG